MDRPGAGVRRIRGVGKGEEGEERKVDKVGGKNRMEKNGKR